MRIALSNYVEIGQTVAEISRFNVFFKTAADAILDCQKFKFLKAGRLETQCAQSCYISS